MKLNYFNFKKIGDKILLTNDFGRFHFVDEKEMKSIIKRDVDLDSELGKSLLQKGFIYSESNLGFSSKNKYPLQSLKGYVQTATSLHIFVVTTACNANCRYCQANNGKKSSNLFMSKEVAQKAVNIALESPLQNLSFEFQGGEPLNNFDIIRFIVEYSEAHKGNHKIEYSVVSNLSLLSEEMIAFFQKYHFNISTSVDGPKEVHNFNRPFQTGIGTFDLTLSGINRIRKAGLNIGAIQTTTKPALAFPVETIKTYKGMGFSSIFIRPLTPLGKAACQWDEIGYSPEEFLVFYRKAMDTLIEMNIEGEHIRENHAAILLQKMRGYMVNYMELRSPCGAAFGQMAYYPDGKIFTCDEGRMLYEMGDDIFCLGNVFTDHYQDLISSSTCKVVCAASTLETIPTCCDCVYQPYCGTCPVINYAGNKDVIEKEPRGYRCKIYSGILDYLFEKYLQGDKKVLAILEEWSN